MTCLRAVLYGSRASRCVVAWRLFKRWGAPAPDGGPQAAGLARMTHRTREWQLLPDAEREDHVLAFDRYVLQALFSSEKNFAVIFLFLFEKYCLVMN